MFKLEQVRTEVQRNRNLYQIVHAMKPLHSLHWINTYLVLWLFRIKGCGEAGNKTCFHFKQVHFLSVSGGHLLSACFNNILFRFYCLNLLFPILGSDSIWTYGALELQMLTVVLHIGDAQNVSSSQTVLSLQHVSQKHVQQYWSCYSTFCFAFLKASEAALGDRTPCTGVHSWQSCKASWNQISKP